MACPSLPPPQSVSDHLPCRVFAHPSPLRSILRCSWGALRQYVNKHIHTPLFYDSIKISLLGDLVLDSWSDHVFHLRWAVLYLTPPCSSSHVTGSSIAEIVSAFPTCGGLCVYVVHVPTPPDSEGCITGILHPRNSSQRSTDQL
jgi:hypothetical protein